MWNYESFESDKEEKHECFFAYFVWFSVFDSMTIGQTLSARCVHTNLSSLFIGDSLVEHALLANLTTT